MHCIIMIWKPAWTRCHPIQLKIILIRTRLSFSSLSTAHFYVHLWSRFFMNLSLIVSLFDPRPVMDKAMASLSCTLNITNKSIFLFFGELKMFFCCILLLMNKLFQWSWGGGVPVVLFEKLLFLQYNCSCAKMDIIWLNFQMQPW